MDLSRGWTTETGNKAAVKYGPQTKITTEKIIRQNGPKNG